MKQKAGIALALLGLACFLLTGCRKTKISAEGSPEQQELMLAFLAAHDKGDLEAAKALVDWDGVSDDYKEHFIRVDLQGYTKEFIKSIGFSPLPALRPEYWDKFNLRPDIFLAVEYGDPKTPGRSNLYPIGEKDGHYLIALQVRQSAAGDWP
ncbi:MAG TPA: hypothetical protein VN025_01205 [Candidatus Dormibacteraeota bacterium]|jgi:hypothetical protein|nr:hypothetical protein [Candidatus Dormibacteraeota bacterium]